jgi:hypothetical protein
MKALLWPTLRHEGDSLDRCRMLALYPLVLGLRLLAAPHPDRPIVLLAAILLAAAYRAHCGSRWIVTLLAFSTLPLARIDPLFFLFSFFALGFGIRSVWWDGHPKPLAPGLASFERFLSDAFWPSVATRAQARQAIQRLSLFLLYTGLYFALLGLKSAYAGQPDPLVICAVPAVLLIGLAWLTEIHSRTAGVLGAGLFLFAGFTMRDPLLWPFVPITAFFALVPALRGLFAYPRAGRAQPPLVVPRPPRIEVQAPVTAEPTLRERQDRLLNHKVF